MITRKLVHQDGFTLIEVMASMIILAIGVLGLAPLIIATIQGNSFGDDMTRATLLAQSKIEELRNISYDLMSSGQDTVGTVQRQWTVQKDVPSIGISQITVQTSWVDEEGNTHLVTLTTLRAE